MVRGGADVPVVDVPAERDPPGGGPDDRRGMHDGGVLAAQLEYGGGEVPGGGLVHDLADLRAAGEEDQVPLLLQQRGGLRHRALGHGERLVSRYLGTSCASTAEQATESSDGLITAVLPPAMAGTSGPRVSMNGSFHAPMIKVTPSGSRRTRT